MTADLSRMSPAARARARGCRPDVPCPEAEEFRDGLESYHEGEVWPADSWAELPLSFRRGYEAGQGGRQLPKAPGGPKALWWWLEHEADKRFVRKRRAKA